MDTTDATTATGNQIGGQEEPRDQNVYSFMMQLVQEKHGDDTDYDYLEAEAGRLYDLFGDVLLNYFEPQLSEDQKVQFDQLIEAGGEGDTLMNFLTEGISNLEEQIVDVLIKFREDYVEGKFGDEADITVDGDQTPPPTQVSTP